MFGKPSPMRGKKHSEESKEKNRLAHLGKHPNLSMEERQRRRNTAVEKCLPALLVSDKNYKSPERSRKLSESKKKQWQDLEWKEAVLKKVFVSNGKKPNRIEIYLDQNIQLHVPKEYIYSGAGEIWIAGKCPDWFNVNGKKKVIEYFSNYFHSKKLTSRSKEQEEKQRIDHFKKYGFDCLIIWESELKDINFVIHKIKEFTYGN